MSAKTLSFLIAAFALATSLTAEAKNGFYPVHFPWEAKSLTAKATDGNGKLQYYGGPVISNVKVYVVLWGNKVNAEVKSKIAGYFTTVTNSTYMDWLNEYQTNLKAIDGRDGTNQRIGRGQYMNTITITPFNLNTTIDDVEIQAELQKQIDGGKLPKPDADTIFMTYFPPGMKITASGMGSCSSFCAYHGFKGTPETDHFYYGVMPDLGGACSFGCGGFGRPRIDSYTSISAHELIEAVTDPFPTPGDKPAYPQAWNDVGGSEIGDICAQSGDNKVTGSNGQVYIVQSEWDNTANACTSQDWSQ